MLTKYDINRQEIIRHMENLTGFGEILEKSLNEIYIFDANTLKFIMINRGARENLGYTSEEIKELTPIDLIPEFPNDRFRRFIAPLFEDTLEKLEFETFHVRKDKTTYDVKVHLQLFKLNRKKVLVAIVDDITEKNLADIRLQQSENHFRTLVSNMPDIIVRYDLDYRIIYISESVSQYTGKQPEFYLGKSTFEFGYSEELINNYHRHFLKAKETGKKVRYESKFPRKSKWVYYVNTVIPEYDLDGDMISFLHIAREITKRKNLENKLRDNIKTLKDASEELVHRNRQLEDFANIASHNLRSPIGNMKMLLLLYNNEPDFEKKKFLIEKFDEVTQRLNNTVDDLTEIVKVKRDLNKKREVIHFNKLLCQIMGGLSAQIMETNAEISSDFSQCEKVYYPKVYLESLLLNLLTNAIKYHSPKRRLKIHFETSVERGKLILSCRDNGLGIDMKRYGDKLFGLNKTFHRHKDSRGVGLFITKNQIEAMGGSIEAKSQVDRGTEFIITFHKKDIPHVTSSTRLCS